MTYLRDYRPTPYVIKHTELRILLDEERTRVESRLYIEANLGIPPGPLVLDGCQLELVKVMLDGQELSPEAYTYTEKELCIPSLPAKCILETVCNIKPKENLALEGLYLSQGRFCTQCEAEGFRRITYYYDRPDIMATFKVRLEADKSRYPVLLANGNCVAKGDLADGQHFMVYEDPFPKPSYLFAVVAGQLSHLADTFITRSGRKVELGIYATEEDIEKCTYAMDCLKKAMAWDEQRFGLECDLEHYKIVAVRDFNLGAMENKGLNVFNSALILAHPDIARDVNYQDILAVIGHEYFHNWTGNRVTCRDWFQLCLKEGLTVFRDQEFSSSQYSAAVKRIEDVMALRQQQWPEDGGPLAHPPRPDRYMEINNFYTATVYNKGAEVVRMLHTLIGPDNFRRGMDLYFARFDGMAVCQEDFVQAMADASGRDLQQFFSWYTEAGTPTVTVATAYEAKSKSYHITFTQSCQTLKGQNGKAEKPRHIPVLMGLLAADGSPLPLQLVGEKGPQGHERLLELREEKQSFTFVGCQSRPIPSLFRRFSAAVKVDLPLSSEELVFLMAHDSDAFNVWDAGQNLFRSSLLKLVKSIQAGEKELKLEPSLLAAVGAVLNNTQFDPAFKSLALHLPSESSLSQSLEVIDVDAIRKAREIMRRQFAQAHKQIFLDLYRTNQGDNSLTEEGMGKRGLKNLCLAYLSTLASEDIYRLTLRQYETSDNMTDRDAALHVMINSSHPERERALADFYKKWRHAPLALDRWFSLQATAYMPSPAETMAGLLAHPDFNLQTPNRMRSVLLSFCSHNPTGFHHVSGYGYRLCADYILRLDKINRHMAALLAKTFQQWYRHDAKRQNLQKSCLNELAKAPGLSSDVYEIISKALG